MKTKKIEKPKILAYDLETSPAKGYFFGGIWETNIIEMIEYEQILCVAWMEHGSNKVHVKGQDDFPSYKPGVLNDKDLVIFFRDIISQYDIVSGHNSDRFDLTVLNTRLLFHGLEPISLASTIDTKKIAKNKFHLPSNKLDDIADFLGLGRKLSTHKSLWMGCEQGVASDWSYMKKYCKWDVKLQDDVLKHIVPFVKFNNTFGKLDSINLNCTNPTCCSQHVVKSKKRKVAGGFRYQYQCMDCGCYFTDSKLIKE